MRSMVSTANSGRPVLPLGAGGAIEPAGHALNIEGLAGIRTSTGGTPTAAQAGALVVRK